MKIVIDSINKTIEVSQLSVNELDVINKCIEAIGGNPKEWSIVSFLPINYNPYPVFQPILPYQQQPYYYTTGIDGDNLLCNINSPLN